MRAKLWKTEENEMVHTPLKELHTNQRIHIGFFFFLLFLKLVDDTNITNARFSVCRYWQGWELVTFLKGTDDESESTYRSGFSSAAGASVRPARTKSSSQRLHLRRPLPCPPSPSLSTQTAGELGTGEFKMQSGMGRGQEDRGD